jgi:tryptophanyl-tRNA synthetase
MARQVSKQLQQGVELDIRSDAETFTLWLDGACVADSPTFASPDAREAAVEALRQALQPQGE